MLKGKGISEGIGIGKALVIKHTIEQAQVIFQFGNLQHKL